MQEGKRKNEWGDGEGSWVSVCSWPDRDARGPALTSVQTAFGPKES